MKLYEAKAERRRKISASTKPLISFRCFYEYLYYKDLYHCTIGIGIGKNSPCANTPVNPN